MTPEEFRKLHIDKQAAIIWKGLHIGDRQDDEYTILLYRCDNLFIEVYVHRVRNVIDKFEAFSKDELPNNYIFKTGFSIN